MKFGSPFTTFSGLRFQQTEYSLRNQKPDSLCSLNCQFQKLEYKLRNLGAFDSCPRRKRKCTSGYSVHFLFLVAGTGIEPVSRGYEPRELPLLYPAICLNPMISFTRTKNLGGCEIYKSLVSYCYSLYLKKLFFKS